ncbi:hypothetical protein BP6252_05961 [Coleophoma cylindrospora]|uniref:Fe2OG dioxygenase domain-containing protein n=1 Tax=Coleophoma cylindrospora TaxID=1849047 RepID=A0A3D8RLA5_9HELO|nr:hypothetical protein BP6252_05961 [Coleophoma cylindrospora]
MATQTTTTTKPGRKILKLDSSNGQAYREISTAAPRAATAEEIPVIDISKITSPELEDRMSIALQIKSAAENSGFFYIKNHGVEEQTISNAKAAAIKFMAEPMELKQKIARNKQKYWNGYCGPEGSQANKTESKDYKEGFGWQYSPDFDPLYDHLPKPIPLSSIPADIREFIRAEHHIWDGTLTVPGFKEDAIAYYRSMINLARRLTKVFALALDLKEDYFDALTTYPGADLAFNYYNPVGPEVGGVSGDEVMSHEVGLGSHTDLQCFTILWQDMIGGLLILNRTGEWIKATPIEGTFVVNIGDFLMRMTNDKWLSTVHRVEVNRSAEPRISMPLFFGFNFNEVIGVLPSCVSEENPAKYEPLRVGDWNYSGLATEKTL